MIVKNFDVCTILCQCFFVFKFNIINFLHGDVKIIVFNKWLILFR